MRRRTAAARPRNMPSTGCSRPSSFDPNEPGRGAVALGPGRRPAVLELIRDRRRVADQDPGDAERQQPDDRPPGRGERPEHGGHHQEQGQGALPEAEPEAQAESRRQPAAARRGRVEAERHQQRHHPDDLRGVVRTVAVDALVDVVVGPGRVDRRRQDAAPAAIRSHAARAARPAGRSPRTGRPGRAAGSSGCSGAPRAPPPAGTARAPPCSSSRPGTRTTARAGCRGP